MTGGDNENGGSGSFSGNVRKFTQAPTPTKYKSQGGGTGDWRPAPHLADWDHWGQMPSAPLWEAVALSLNWEPHSMIGPTYQVSFDFSRQRAPKEFQSHLAVAEKCMTRGEMPFAQRVENAPYSEVDLKPFAGWAISKGWKIPDEFPRATSVDVAADRTTRVQEEGAPTRRKADAYRSETMRKAIIKLHAQGDNAAALQWGPFCNKVRDECEGWSDTRKKNINWGFRDRTIENLARELLSKNL